jgi:HEPN domain-containing protein
MTRPREQVIWGFVRDWLRKAEGDLNAAELLLTVDQEDYFAAAFHAQQAAEKFLKALLVRHQVPFPKTHDIEHLLRLVSPAEPSLAQELPSAHILTPFGVEFRYPGEQTAKLEAAQEALEEANRVKEAVLKCLRGYLGEGPSANPVFPV